MTVRRPLLVVCATWYAVVLAIGLPPEAHFLIYGLLGSAVITLGWSPHWRTAGFLAIGTMVLLPLHVSPIALWSRVWTEEPGFPLAYLGLAAMVYLSIRWLRGDVPREVLWGAIGIPTFILLTEPFHTLVIRSTPRTLDPVLQKLDVTLFGETTFAAGRLLATHPWLQIVTVWSYVALALVGAGVYTLALRGRAGGVRPEDMLWPWALAGGLGAICYFFVPAVGPRWVFSDWPWHLPELTSTRSTPMAAVPRNAMPSLHATWALLVCWSARRSPGKAWLFLVPWVVLMLIATLGAGGHYLIDLVAAVPLACFAAWLGEIVADHRLRERAKA